MKAEYERRCTIIGFVKHVPIQLTARTTWYQHHYRVQLAEDTDYSFLLPAHLFGEERLPVGTTLSITAEVGTAKKGSTS